MILITLLSMASHSENSWEWNGKKFKVQPGQMVTSLESIAKKAGAGISIRNVRTALQRFEKLEFLTNESTKRGRLITIVNWRVFQDNENQPDKQPDNYLTKTRQRPDNYQELKELKNIISVASESATEEIKARKIIPPTVEEVTQYCLERKNGIHPEQFIDFYSAKNWYIGKNKMKDWQAAIRTWEKNRVEPFAKKEYGGEELPFA